MLRCVVLGLIALFACAAVAHAQQPAEPLTLKLTSSRQLCTAGTLTQVSWIISGGTPPYALTINGEEVAAAAPHALASCGAMVDDGLEWLLSIGRQRHVTAVATDSLGAAATASARLTLAAALDPPTDAQSRSFLVWLHTPVPVQFEFGDPQIRTRWRAGTPPWQPAARYMLLRWRVQGADRWAYEAPAPVERFESEQLHKWSVDKSLIDRVLEIQLAHLRRGIERESPHALSWSPPQLISAAPPRDIVAKTTHDTITLSWGPNSPGTHYTAALSAGGSDSPSWDIDVGPTCPCEAQFDSLLPDTWYRVHVGFAEGYIDPQWSFDLRTEPAPPDWSADNRLPRNIEARSVEAGLEITWEPPLAEPKFDYQVCVIPVARPFFFYECHSVNAGEQRHVRAMQSPVTGTYRVRVSHQAIPAAAAERIVYLPYPEAADAVSGSPPPPPDVRHEGWRPALIDPPESYVLLNKAAFRFFWDDAVDAERAELEWENQGRPVRLQVSADDRAPYFSVDTIAPVVFRVRYLTDGVWTPWSAPIRIPLTPDPPYYVQVDERGGELIIEWRPSVHQQPVDGYRVYICCPNLAEEVVDAGMATSISYPISADEAEYSVAVTAYSDEGGEGPRSHTDTYRAGEPLTLGLSSSYDWSEPCKALPGFKQRVDWQIIGGSPPYLLAFGDGAASETLEREGAVVVDCRTDFDLDSSEKHLVDAHVTDHRGRSASDSAKIRYVAPEPEQDQERQSSIRLARVSAHRTHIWLAWTCHEFWARVLPLALRWRSDETSAWTYMTPDQFPQRSYVDHHCRGQWVGVEPSTRYEFQLAYYRDAALEQLDWTPSRHVTTPGPPADVRLEADASGVAVSWRAQADAWAYQVILRTAATSWWTYHEPSGQRVERVLFPNLPADVDYEIEIITPPLSNGEERLIPNFWPPPHLYHE